MSRVGNQKHYQANRAAPIFDELEAIVDKTMRPPSPQSAAAGIPQALHEARAQYNLGKKRVSHDVPKHRLASFCRRHHIKRLGIFGSAARGEAGATSDVDLLVEFKHDAPASLFDMVRMRDELSRLFGRKVDLATSTVLENPYRRRSILKDLRELYAA